MSDERPGIEISAVDPKDVAGVYANYAQVGHTIYEFTIDFARLEGDPPKGVLVARVNMSPLLVSQLLSALQENWSRYAERALPPEARSHGGPEDQPGSSNDDAAT